MSRLFYLDNLKGLLIILVVLGHAIQGFREDYQHDVLFRVIYSFHMPLFFLISGFLTFKEHYDSTLIKKRFVQCIIPFITWAFLSPVLKYGAIDLELTVKALWYPDNGLWFLYNLFFYCAIINVTEKISGVIKVRQEYVLLAAFVLLYALMAVFHTLFNVTQICWYFPFFAMGYYMRKYPQLSEYKVLRIVLGGGYFVAIPFWMMREDPLFYQWVDFGPVFSYGYRLFVEIAGAYTFFILGKMLLNRRISAISYLGTKTLGIYAFQFIMLHHFTIRGDSYYNVFLTTLVCTIASVVCVEIVHRIRYLRLFLIGEK